MRVMADKAVGKITHYYDKISVAVLNVTSPIHVGDTIKIIGHGNEYKQTIESMQIEHEQIKTAKKGMTIGIKVEQPVKEADKVFLVIAK